MLVSVSVSAGVSVRVITYGLDQALECLVLVGVGPDVSELRVQHCWLELRLGLG